MPWADSPEMRTNLLAATPLAPYLEEAGFCLWDVGARGGIDPLFAPFAFAVDAVGFEPDPEAFPSLRPTGAWRSERFYETAIGAASGRATLNIPTDPAGASFLDHDPAVGRRYGLGALFDVQQRLEIGLLSMDDAVAALGIPAPNLLKLDVEGLELDILRGGTTQIAGLAAVKAEVSFIAQRRNQPLAHEMIAFMGERGFCLAGIVGPALWRTKPWAPDPYLVRTDRPYSRGRLAQADLLFLREPGSVSGEGALRAGLAAMALGYFDHGTELVAASGEGADRIGEIGRAAAATARIYGRARAREALGATLCRALYLARSLCGGLGVPRGSA